MFFVVDIYFVFEPKSSRKMDAASRGTNSMDRGTNSAMKAARPVRPPRMRATLTPISGRKAPLVIRDAPTGSSGTGNGTPITPKLDLSQQQMQRSLSDAASNISALMNSPAQRVSMAMPVPVSGPTPPSYHGLNSSKNRIDSN